LLVASRLLRIPSNLRTLPGKIKVCSGRDKRDAGVALETVIDATPTAFVCAVVALWLAEAEPINPKVTDWFASGAPDAFVTVAETVTGLTQDGYTFPYGQYGAAGVVSLDGYFYETCTFGFGCDDVHNENIDRYGNYWADSWTF
jgi:hypothetical protein